MQARFIGDRYHISRLTATNFCCCKAHDSSYKRTFCSHDDLFVEAKTTVNFAVHVTKSVLLCQNVHFLLQHQTFDASHAAAKRPVTSPQVCFLAAGNLCQTGERSTLQNSFCSSCKSVPHYCSCQSKVCFHHKVHVCGCQHRFIATASHELWQRPPVIRLQLQVCVCNCKLALSSVNFCSLQPLNCDSDHRMLVVYLWRERIVT